MNRNRRRSGFTLIEVMIIIMIIVILMEIAVPNFIMARTTSQRSSCMNNLKQIDAAKEEWAMDNRAPAGAAVNMTDIAGVYIRGAATGPVCPGGGSYKLNPVGNEPECSLSAGPAFHVLPY